MLQGKCPKCNSYFFGYALLNPKHQYCPKCGLGLEISENGQRLFIGYSPFTGERYYVNPNNASSLDKDRR